MEKFSGATGIAKLLSERLGRHVPPRHVSDALWQNKELRDKCPMIGKSRAIPVELLPELQRIIEERNVRNGAKVTAG